MAGKAGSPESESFESVKRQTSQTDDLQFTRNWLSLEVVHDQMWVTLKLKGRKLFLPKETRPAVVFGP